MIIFSDPTHKALPPYTDKCESSRDCNTVRHLLNGRDVKMSNVIWEVGLRRDSTHNQLPKNAATSKSSVRPKTSTGARAVSAFKKRYD